MGRGVAQIRTFESFQQNPQQSMHAHANVYTAEQIIQLKKKKWAEVTTSRLQRQHKKKTRLNFKFTYCIYMLNNEITKYINN